MPKARTRQPRHPGNVADNIYEYDLSVVKKAPRTAKEKKSDAKVNAKKTLADYAEKVKTLPKITPKTSPNKALAIAEKIWNYGAEISIRVNQYWRTLSKEAIDASTGSPAFLVPEDIEDNMYKGVKAEKLVEYAHPTPSDQLMRAGTQYFRTIGIISESDKLTNIIDNPESLTMQIGNGTTELFNDALTAVIKNDKDVIIVPSPSYGLFIDPIIANHGKVHHIKLTKENGFKPQAESIRTLINRTNDELLAKFKVKLDLLTENAKKHFSKTHDLIVSLENIAKATKNVGVDSKMLQALIDEYNNKLKTQKKTHPKNSKQRIAAENLMLESLKRVRGYLNINPNMPLGVIADQKEIDHIANTIKQFPEVTVIDDLAYYDMKLPEIKTKIGTFSKSPVSHKTITLYGLSKQFGLAGLRAGVAIAQYDYMKRMRDTAFHRNPTMSEFVNQTLKTVFEMDATERAKHLRATNAEYGYRRDFAIALIEGLDHIVNKQNKARITQDITEIIGKRSVDVNQCLKGIPNVKLLTHPESGFFIVVDFSKYKNYTLAGTKMETSFDFYTALRFLMGVNSIPLEMCYDTHHCGLRISDGLAPQDLTEVILRIKNLVTLLEPPAMPKAAVAQMAALAEKAAAPVMHMLDKLHKAIPVVPKSTIPSPAVRAKKGASYV